MDALANILVAVSNAPAVPVVRRALATSTLLGAVLAFTALASFVSHLLQSHKHGMHGFGCPPALSDALNRADGAGCFATVIVFVYELLVTRRVPRPPLFLWVRLALAYGVLFASEYHAHDASLKWILFVPAHMLWHVLIFGVVRDALPPPPPQ